VTLQNPGEKIIRNKYVTFGVIALVTALIIFVAYNERGDELLPASTLAYASCFILTIYFLRKRMSSLFDILLTSAATTFSGVWLYEVAYHYYWGINLSGLKYDFSNLSIVLYPGWAFPIYFAVAIIFFPFLKRQYISLNKPLVAVFGISVALFALWAALGYPQYFNPQLQTGIFTSQAQVQGAGLIMNSVTKILAVVPAFLFCDRWKINLGRKREMQKQISLDRSVRDLRKDL
jgi:hypothetical protein